MTRLLRPAVAALALLTPLLAGAPAAHASEDYVIAGSGMIEPGLPCSGCPEHWDFTAVMGGGDGRGVDTCWYDGTVTGNELAANGDGTLSCSGVVTITGHVAYARTGVYLDMLGTVQYNGGLAHCERITLGYVFTSARPVSTVAFTGHGGACISNN